jgi:hypothetical protein
MHCIYHFYICNCVYNTCKGWYLILSICKKCLQEIRKPSAHQGHPNKRNQRLGKNLHRAMQGKWISPQRQNWLSAHPPRSNLPSLQHSVTQRKPQGLKWCSHIGATCTTKLARRTTLSSRLIAIWMSEY